ncbi:MAG: tRNA (guanosine(37)-N1)-methyltransferase TrmD [Candidatus Nomurabacteria bacterium]|jgi:tRNA (guanine37-N1)-methyltransferase|nr:tRNA (guanosine(37)-N1)-methyltransferase TrmD [Candidatus Nomurabacteria bacterium]
MKFSIITLFPEMFDKVLSSSMMWKAQEKGLAEFELIDLREFGIGPRRQVDDSPYGGGDGMLMRVEPIFAAVEFARSKSPHAKVLLMTPKGIQWKQNVVKRFADAEDDFIIICPHYEGYDERILALVDEQISMGQFILTGGELPAMMVVDSIVRLIPGVLGGETSAEIESFSDGDNLEYPQYTRPEEFRGVKVPAVLLSGDHGEVARWRDENSSRVG